MNKIRYDSRYFDLFESLQNSIRSDNEFTFLENKKEPYKSYLSYDRVPYITTINSISLSNEVYNRIISFFDSNLFNQNERELFIENLIPIVDIYGNDTITKMQKTINYLVDGIKKGIPSNSYSYDQLEEYIFELKKTIKELIETREFLQKKVKIFNTKIDVDNRKSSNEKDIELDDLFKLNLKTIHEKFNNIDDKGWKYAFRNEKDYILFSQLLASFFNNEEYIIPDTIIKIKTGSKTKVAKALNEIHKDLSDIKLIYNKEFFRIIQTLNHFQEEKNLYKTISR